MAGDDPDSKIVVVFGITGIQGSSVAKAFVNQPGWRVRGVTRQSSSSIAQRWQSEGADIVYGDLDDPASVRKALSGAHAVFGATDFWQHLRDPQIQLLAAEGNEPINALAFVREIKQGQTLMDAVATTLPSLERFIFSTLSSAKIASNNSIDFNFHFDSKAEMLRYLREKHPELWAKTSLLTLGCYAGNWRLYKDGAGRPEKIADGVYKVYLPMNGDKPLPFVEPNADTGRFVEALMKMPPGTNLVGAGSLITWSEWCDTWGRVNSVKCTFERQDRQVIEDAAGVIGREIADMYQFFDEYGYCGVDEEDTIYPWDLPFEVKYTTMEEYMQSQDWGSVLIPDRKVVEAP